MTRDEALETMRQRRNWLRERIKAKQTINWDVEWDQREERALSYILTEEGIR